jgi:ABC-type lipoprotein export system ATPase subunit
MQENAPGMPGEASACCPLIAAERASRLFSHGNCVALEEADFSVNRGEYVAIKGPSGSGKSTLLHLLSGLDRPTSGRILFDGDEPKTNGAWSFLRSRHIGFVFQAFNLLPTLTARQNIEVPMLGVIRGTKERARRVDELLEQVKLTHRVNHRPPELSGGEKQRLAIARSLANGPEIILADEPTGNLDSISSLVILDLLEKFRCREGTAIVLVTHDSTIADRAERQIVMRDGRIVSDQPSSEIG